MSDYTIVEKYQLGKSATIAVRPFFSPNKENMGLEQYGLSLHDGVFHEENLACLEMNGVKRYVTGLNEFAPEVKMLSKEKKKAKKYLEQSYLLKYNDCFSHNSVTIILTNNL